MAMPSGLRLESSQSYNHAHAHAHTHSHAHAHSHSPAAPSFAQQQRMHRHTPPIPPVADSSTPHHPTGKRPASNKPPLTTHASAPVHHATPSLFPPLAPSATHPSSLLQNGDVTATDNVMNSVADASSSLFQICVTLRLRLQGVPGFDDSLQEEEEDADEDTDPVTLLWRTFRRGYPLMLLYNALRPDQPLTLPSHIREDKRGKACTFKFLQACITDLKFKQEDCFIITDLYGDDTTGFVKVAKVVNRVLDILVQRGLVEEALPTAATIDQIKKTQRQHIVAELVTTERTYVQHLELLQAFKHLVEEKGAILGDAVHDIFLNLNSLLDFQRRFLIRVEQTNHLPEDEQNWGKLFVLYCDAFKVYEPYIANQRKCEKTVVAQFDKLAAAAAHASTEIRQMLESPTNLYGFLMKPFQRLAKYPLLLQDLYNKGDLDDQRKEDLLIGKEAATSVLARTNRAVDREEKAEAVQELKLRVEDWKGHRVEGFGDLLLYGTFTVLKSENMGLSGGGPSGGKEGERQYHVYLFETILLCCKDIDLSKPKNKLSNKSLVDKRGKPKLQLKGRIFMQNVTDLISLAKPGSYTIQIFWKGDPSIENFIIRFTTEDMLRRWSAQIESQRRKYRDRAARSSEGNRSLGTSTTEFEYMRGQSLENPYAQFGDDDDDDAETLIGSMGGGFASGVSTVVGGQDLEFLQGRNLSFSSLSLGGRSRGESISSLRGGPSRPAQPGLSLRTRELGEGPPPESYFSPIDGSPSALSSSRTSASSTMTGLWPVPNRGPNGTPLYEEPHYPPANASRFTAPAFSTQQRGPSVISMQQTAAASTGRQPPLRPGMHSSQPPSLHPRHRSASSPDIHNQLPGSTNMQPPLPNLPATYLPSIPRSQTNSPALPNGRPGPGNGNTSPLSARHDPPANNQLKVKVHCPSVSQTLTLVVPVNISYQSLKDRIDAKLQRSTNLTLSERGSRGGKGSGAGASSAEMPPPPPQMVKLKFFDEGDFVSIQSDEDVQTAFEDVVDGAGTGLGMGEVELWCQR